MNIVKSFILLFFTILCLTPANSFAMGSQAFNVFKQIPGLYTGIFCLGSAGQAFFPTDFLKRAYEVDQRSYAELDRINPFIQKEFEKAGLDLSYSRHYERIADENVPNEPEYLAGMVRYLQAHQTEDERSRLVPSVQERVDYYWNNDHPMLQSRIDRFQERLAQLEDKKINQ